MRLIVHMGFHKTASTHLQALMNGNAERLAERGIWYARQPGYPAHHSVAHALMTGDRVPLEAMFADALGGGAHTIVLSSEDLECALFNPAVSELIEQAAAAYGIGPIEWHAALREPGAYYESLYAQLSWHSFADAFHMFSEVMKKGMLFMPEPFAGECATPYWFYCFDYQPFLAAFAATGRAVVTYDYADNRPYPGWRLLGDLNVLDAITEPADEAYANHRLTPATIAEHFSSRLSEAVRDEQAWADIREAAAVHIATNQAVLPRLARIVGERYCQSYRDALDQFGRARPEDRMAA